MVSDRDSRSSPWVATHRSKILYIYIYIELGYGNMHSTVLPCYAVGTRISGVQIVDPNRSMWSLYQNILGDQIL